MLPCLKPRQHVLSIVSKKIKKGDLVIVKDSLNSKFVKRVMWVDDEKFKVVSDNKNYPSHITDKALSNDNLIGKVILKF